MAEDREAPDGAAEIERLEREFATLMGRLDRMKGFGGDAEVARAHEDAPLDPMLERDLQRVLQAFLAKQGGAGLDLAQMDEAGIDQALRKQVGPLFEALLATATGHAKAAHEAIAGGRDPSTRKVAELTLDLTDLLEDDS